MHNRVVWKWRILSCRLHRRWPLVLMAVSAAMAIAASAFDLRVNTTASMPIGLYREVPRRLERGAWVVFCLPEEPAWLGRERGYLRRGSCADGSQELVKEIAAVPGDSVALSRAGLTVNSHAFPGTAIQAVDRSGRGLPHAAFGERRVAPGELWVLGQGHSVSWDSRYFGPLPARQVRAGAIPVLTFALGSGQAKDAGDRP
jgi:conjugative transfer signal peptidase TraF